MPINAIKEVDHRAAFLQEDKLAATLADSCRDDRTLPAADPPIYVCMYVCYSIECRPRRLYIPTLLYLLQWFRMRQVQTDLSIIIIDTAKNE